MPAHSALCWSRSCSWRPGGDYRFPSRHTSSRTEEHRSQRRHGCSCWSKSLPCPIGFNRRAPAERETSSSCAAAPAQEERTRKRHGKRCRPMTKHYARVIRTMLLLLLYVAPGSVFLSTTPTTQRAHPPSCRRSYPGPAPSAPPAPPPPPPPPPLPFAIAPAADPCAACAIARSCSGTFCAASSRMLISCGDGRRRRDGESVTAAR